MWFAYFSFLIETDKVNKKDYSPVPPKTIKRKTSNLPTQWKQRVQDGNFLSNATQFKRIPSSILVTR